MNPKDFLDKKTKTAITKETFAIWEMGFLAGYESCMEDAADYKEKVVKPVKEKVIDPYNVRIIELIDHFRKFNPGVQYGHRGHREALKELLKLYEIEDIKKMIDSAFEIQGKPFAPSISNPYELLTKLTKLETFLNRE